MTHLCATPSSSPLASPQPAPRSPIADLFNGPSGPDARKLAYAARQLPRYTSYPTALRFAPVSGDHGARAWAGAVAPDESLSVYVHTPFCDRLCWYCGCHTTVVHGYDRVAAFHARLLREIELWRGALAPGARTAHLHFGGGSPNALRPDDFLQLALRLREAFAVRADAEVAVELDPAGLDADFLDALADAGVTRASLGVQTFDPEVQRKVNRVQPYEQVAEAVAGLRARGVAGLNFDLMYGLPGQTPDNVAETAQAAAGLRPDRIAVFGYAHVPWMKKHQVMIRDAELADVAGRWAQAAAADQVLVAAGYERIGLDHYALPDDGLTRAARAGTLRRNFQGYTEDPAPVLIPLGPSSIGRFPSGYLQNVAAMDAWAHAVDRGDLPVAKTLSLEPEDVLRAAVIERLMCELKVDVGAICAGHGAAEDALDGELFDVRTLAAEGLCAVEGRVVTIPESARRLMRVVAACFDADLPAAGGRHARAV